MTETGRIPTQTGNKLGGVYIMAGKMAGTGR